MDTRCVTPPEAMWRLYENKLHDQSHTIYELHVHLENGQRIFFIEGQEEKASRRDSTKSTILTAWFALNLPTYRREMSKHIIYAFCC